MFDELKDKVSELEHRMKSWPRDTDTKVQTLHEHLDRVEKHIRHQQALLAEKQKEIFDLTRDNRELKSIVSNLIRIAEELLKFGPQTWVPGLNERCSELLQLASRVEESPGSTDPNREASDLGVVAGASILPADPIPETSDDHGKPRLVSDSEFLDETGLSIAQHHAKGQETTQNPARVDESGDEGEDPLQSVVERTKALLSQAKAG